MNLVIDALLQFAQQSERRIAIVHGERHISFRQLCGKVELLQRNLLKFDAQTVAYCTANRLHALEIDLACQRSGLIGLSLPNDCSADTLRKLVLCHGIEMVLADRRALYEEADLQYEYCPDTKLYRYLSPVLQQTLVPDDCAMLALSTTEVHRPLLLSISQQNISYTAAYLARLRVELGIDNYLSLPFASNLSETFAGQYASLISGGCCFLPQQPNIRHCSKNLIDDCAHLALEHGVQSVLIPSQCRRSFLRFVEKTPLVVANLKMVLVSGPPQANFPETDEASDSHPVVYDLWGTPDHSLPYALVRPGEKRARLLPHCTVNVAPNGHLNLNARASIVFDSYEQHFQSQPIYTGLTDFFIESNFLQIGDPQDV